MFFLLSKTLDLAIDPWWWSAGLLSAGAAVLWRGKRKRLGTGLAVAGALVLLVFSLPAVSNRLWASLEQDAPHTARADGTWDVVILLGGTVSPMGSLAEDPAWNDSVERLLVTRELLVSGRAKLAIVTGGPLGIEGLKPEATYLAQELQALGVAADRVVAEPRAKNTRENAVESQRLMKERGLTTAVVVTSAFHARRAAGCFRAAGVQVDLWPVDYRVRDPALDAHVFPRAEYLGQSAHALRERLGRLTYRLLGYSREDDAPPGAQSQGGPSGETG